MLMLLAMTQALMPAPAPADAIAPPLDTVLRHSVEEVREDGRSRRVFRILREIVFAAEPEGYRATVTLREAAAEGSPAERDNYRAANAPMLGRPVVMHLDRAGRLRSVDDLPTVWDAWIAGLGATRSPGASADGDAVRARLRAMPPARIAAVVGSMVTELIVPAAERQAVAARPVSLASPPPFNSVTLTGTASAALEGERLRIRLAATGEAPATSERPAARIAVTAQRVVDPKSGLLLSSTRSEKVSARGLSLTSTNTVRLAW